MPSITFDRFDSGLDLRKGPSVSDANRLRVMDNCYVTTGKTIRQRPGMVLVANLEPGTVGLRAASGKLNTFFSVGTVTDANPIFKPNKIPNPTNASLGLSKIHYADSFNGFLYVSSEYLNGEIKHHYLDGSAVTAVTDTNCPHTAAVIKKASKIFAVKDDVVRFSKTGNPRDWTAANDAGFLGVGVQQTGATHPTALGEFEGNLVVFFADSSQVWVTDPDPLNMRFVQSLDVGCPYPYGAANMAGDVFFANFNGIRSITVQSTNNSLIDVDVGSPIDNVLRPILRPNSSVKSFYFRGGGQFWLLLGSVAYVYSFSRTSKISAWSRYVFPFIITDATEMDGDLYFRAGNDVYRFDDEQTTDAGIVFDVNIELAYLDFQSPGILKMVSGLDAVMIGEMDIAHKYDARDTGLITQSVLLGGDTRPGEMTPVEIVSVGIAPVIRSRNDKPFELHALTYYFNPLGAMS